MKGLVPKLCKFVCLIRISQSVDKIFDFFFALEFTFWSSSQVFISVTAGTQLWETSRNLEYIKGCRVKFYIKLKSRYTWTAILWKWLSYLSYRAGEGSLLNTWCLYKLQNQLDILAKKSFVAFLMSFTTLITKWTGILHVKGRINLIGVLEKHETTVETSSEDLKSP